MKIYTLTNDVGEAEASTPVSNPTDARRILYYLYRRSNRTASDDMISSIFGGDKSKTRNALNILTNAGAIRQVGA